MSDFFASLFSAQNRPEAQQRPSPAAQSRAPPFPPLVTAAPPAVVTSTRSVEALPFANTSSTTLVAETASMFFSVYIDLIIS